MSPTNESQNESKGRSENNNSAKKHANQAKRRRILLWSAIVLLVATALAFLFRPQAIEVDLHTVDKGALVVSIDEEGQTRVHDVYTFSAPVAGELDRIELEVGDRIEADATPLVVIHPQSPSYLDVRSEKQAKAAVATARSSLQYAKAELERIQSDLDFAKSEHERAIQLRQEQVIPARQLEDAEHKHKAAHANLDSARAAVQMRNFELRQAQAMLLSPADNATHGEDCACMPLTSPITGQVLKVYDPSARTVMTGAALIDIGDASDLEVVVDLLSVDAVQVQVGGRVLITDWGGEGTLEGRVRRIEPFGFTKVSALGIEEQRVNVIIDLISPKEQWQRLGHAYQVGLKVVLWEDEEVLTVPLTAIFRKKLSLKNAEQDDWAIFVVEGNKVIVRDIKLGQRSGLDVEVLNGLQKDEKIILHPSNKIKDGVRVADRAEGF